MKKPRLAYTTELGRAYQGDSREFLLSSEVIEESLDLIFTSPPFALTRSKDYGNKPAHEYVEWFKRFVPAFMRALAPHGSLVIDVGGAYLPGAPRRSTYHYELAVMLSKEFDLCQEFYWYNPAKLPSPAEWVNVRRLRVKDSVNLVLWFAKDASNTKADNRRVLRRYSDSMRTLQQNGYQIRRRPSNWDISSKFLSNQGGAIPPNLLGFAGAEQSQLSLEGDPAEDAFDNLLAVANTASRSKYLDECRRYGIKPHGARFPLALPAFFIEFLTEPGDLVCDPFAGSNTTGAAAEAANRRWLSCELDADGPFAGKLCQGVRLLVRECKFETGIQALTATQLGAPFTLRERLPEERIERGASVQMACMLGQKSCLRGDGQGGNGDLLRCISSDEEPVRNV